MTRAPLVPAVALIAAGILAGLQRPVPSGGGPLAFGVAVLGILVACLAMAGARFRLPLLAGLLALTGLALGTAARTQADHRCLARLPTDTPVEIEGVLESVAAGKLRVRLRAVAVRGSRRPCDETVLARWEGEGAGVGARTDDAAGADAGAGAVATDAAKMPFAGDPVVGTGRVWRPGSAGGLRSTGLLMLDTLHATGAASAAGEPTLGAPSLRGSRLARLRGGAARRLEGLYGERAGLAASMLIAHRDGLDREVRDRFARSGLAHLLAISGLHVGLVAGLLLLAGRIARLRARWASALAGAGTVSYVLFLGAPAAASRAALQVVLLLVASAVQRPARSEAVVATAALALLALDPASLAEPGFQLSFAGVAGLLAMRRPLLARLGWLARWRPARVGAGKWLADGLATGVAATLATAPIVAWHFGQVAVVGVAANLVAIPLVGALVPTLALSLVAGAAWEPAGAFVAGSGGVLLGALDAVARAAAGVPGGSMSVMPITAALWTVAALLAWALTRRIGAVRPAVRGLAAGAVALAVVALSAVRVPTDHVEIHVIDVGQGDAVAIRSPGGRWLLVDAGMAGQGYDAGERRVVPYLMARGARRLEGLVLTHPHADHFGGAGAVLRTLRPRWVGDPGLSAGSAAYLELLTTTTGAGVPWLGLGEGVELDMDGVAVEFLHPWGGEIAVEDPNDVSVVLRVVYGEFSALLTGDAPAIVEEALARRWGYGLEAEVLKAGHHGSATSTSGALLGATGAKLALISAGRGNRYGHPHAAVLARLDSAGVRVLRTDRDGSIVVRGGRDGSVRVETRR